ncbi:hypothetical protein [Streptomyces sp. NPDC059861]|uniref:hypothetical protein n=1 Tax=Streptomyces sp. NPDC059861 TaxID=3346974 RepID=UPI003667EB3C
MRRFRRRRCDGRRRHTEVGIRDAGTNYFYCRHLGRRETSGQWTDVWWGRAADDDAGAYVSAVHIQGGDNDAPLCPDFRCAEQ